MNITDRNLIEVIQTLSPAEAKAVEDCLRSSRIHTAATVLQSETLRKIKARLKARARKRFEAKHKWLM